LPTLFCAGENWHDRLEGADMSAVQALKAARDIGIHLGIDGDDLVLEASMPPPAAVLEAVSRHKAEIISLLRLTEERWSVDDWQVFFAKRAGISGFDGGVPRREAEARAFEACVVEWLNRNPAPSQAGRCAWCGRPESASAVVLPFGTEPGTHSWLHPECWPARHEARRAEAIAALRTVALTARSPGIRRP
jgi:hypothetical protein